MELVGWFGRKGLDGLGEKGGGVGWEVREKKV